jgi:hypothetical protein
VEGHVSPADALHLTSWDVCMHVDGWEPEVARIALWLGMIEPELAPPDIEDRFPVNTILASGEFSFNWKATARTD